jgi:mRNA-degrading endonuclease RelE of RelBE toxin-antitoxin system
MEHKLYQVIVEQAAEQKFDGHLEFLSRVSETAAFHLYEAREKALDFLEENPESCPPYESKTPTDIKLRSKMFHGRYRIVFTIQEKIVYAYDIQDCRQDEDKYLI